MILTYRCPRCQRLQNVRVSNDDYENCSDKYTDKQLLCASCRGAIREENG